MNKTDVEDMIKYVISRNEYKEYFNNQVISKSEYDNFCREKSRSRKTF